MAADTCRLCLRSVDKEKSSNLLTETTKLGMLKEFLPELNLDFSENTQVCDRCVEELETSYNFKQGVVVYEANIQAKLEGKKQKKIDLKLMLDAIAKKELKKSDYICRTCLSICRTPSISLFESPSNMMPYNFVKKMCEVVFELEFIASTKPVLCDDCWETLQTVYNFRKSCLRTDKRLRVYVASNNITKLSVDEFKKFAEENPVKDDDEVSSDDELDGYVKDEPIDEEELKFDPDEASCSSSSVKVKEETIVKCESEINSDDEDIEDEPELLDPKAVKSEASELDGEDCKMEIGDVKVDAEGEGVAGTSGKQSMINKTDKFKLIPTTQCTFKSNVRKKRNSKCDRFMCADCPYTSRCKSDLQRHLIKHKKLDEVNWFECAHCPYKAKARGNLISHLRIYCKPLTHTSVTDKCVQWFTCADCSYKSPYKSAFQLHLLQHKDPDEIEWFKCAYCSFKAKRKISLVYHLRLHKSVGCNDTQWFTCAHCSYKSRHFANLQRHLLLHKEPNEVQWFECAHCSFKTKHKHHLVNHFQTHKTINTSTQLFTCTHCSYKTGRKDRLQNHLSQHNNHVQSYECAQCSYKTKNRLYLVNHVRIHRTNKHNGPHYSYKGRQDGHPQRHLLQGEKKEQFYSFQCNQCSFKTNRRASLANHAQLHKAEKKFTCPYCAYICLKNSQLQAHLLQHKNPDEIQWFRCDKCLFKAKRKDSLAKHVRIH